MKARVVAALAIKEVAHEGRSLTAVMPRWTARLSDKSERGLVQELCYGVLRWLPRLEQIAGLLLRKPLKSKDYDVYALILCGLYQLLYMRVPDHAAVSETAACAKGLKKPWATALINATLRNFLREKESLLAQADSEACAQFAFPSHLLARIRQDWPDDWQQIVAASNGRAPMTLRVNLSKTTRSQYLQLLAQADVAAQPFPHSDCGVVLDSPLDVTQLPHFADGWVAVQDGGAQVVPALLDLAKGMRVLDACAAPGGKTCHMLESVADELDLLALDKDEQRLARVEENLSRLGLHAKTRACDAGAVSEWWDGQPFDRILLDAPCSALGVIRRHPDIKQLRREQDFAQLVLTQQELLNRLWPLLKTGGVLLYATCSICREENEQQLSRFLTEHEDAQEWEIDQAWGRSMRVGRQILPGDGNMDGFYYARLRKR